MSLYWKLNKISRKIIIRQQRHLNIKLTDCNSLSEIVREIKRGVEIYNNSNYYMTYNFYNCRNHIKIVVWENILNLLRNNGVSENINYIDSVFKLIYELKKNNYIGGMMNSVLVARIQTVILEEKTKESRILNQAITSEEEFFRGVWA